MTFTPLLPPLPPLPPDHHAPARLGDWTLRAGRRNVSGTFENAYLERHGEQIPLVHCSGLLTDFAERMHLLQSDIDRRYEATCHA